MRRALPRQLVLALLIPGSLSLGDIVVLPAVADTSLFELDPDFNFGRQRTLPAGSIGSMFPASGERSRSLFKFDVTSAIPPGSTIQAARMELTVSVRIPAGAAGSTFALSRVLVDWDEGAGLGEIPGGRPALTGETTWNSRFHPGTPWSSPGGAFGVDYANDQSASVENVGGNRATPTVYTFAFNEIGLSDLELMVNGTAPNFGWVLHTLSEDTQKTARRWASRESIIDGPPPVLEITYTPPSLGPPVLKSALLDSNSGEIAVGMDVTPGFRYQLEESDDLVSWSEVGEAQVPSEPGELEFRTPQEGRRKFVRIAVTPVAP